MQFCRLSFKETTQASVNDTDDISEQQTLGVEKMFFLYIDIDRYAVLDYWTISGLFLFYANCAYFLPYSGTYYTNSVKSDIKSTVCALLSKTVLK